MIEINLDRDCLESLDLTPVQEAIQPFLTGNNLAAGEQQISFKIDFPREADDPRELSEIPEIRLWFVRLDAVYPWLPFFLDWKGGELARYAAMLVPHQFNPNEGIQYNPEALEIFVIGKVFLLADWLAKQEIPSPSRLKSLAQMFGYELDDSLFALILS